MKILLSLVLAAFPAVVSAQSVSGTLEMVQNMSVSAGSDTDLARAREDAGKPFAAAVALSPEVQPVNGSRYTNTGAHNNTGTSDISGRPANLGSHYNPGHPGNPPPPLVVVHAHNTYAPGQQHLTPVIPGSAISIIMGVLAITLLVLLCL